MSARPSDVVMGLLPGLAEVQPSCTPPEESSVDGHDALRSLLDARVAHGVTHASSPAVGELIAVADEGRTGWVSYAGQPGTAALAARTVVSLNGCDIGQAVVLIFEGADPLRPIVMGVLRAAASVLAVAGSGQVELSADGARLTVVAKDRLELRCGAASITLTKAGRIHIEGDYVLTRSSGVNRIVGGTVQIN